MSLRVTNTLTRQKEPFEPLEPGHVRMYVCGPTVYADVHIGHAMSAIVFDMIRRYLEYRGYRVTFAMNFTDVDDKIIQRAASLGIPPNELAEQLIDAWLDETAALNIKPATIYPRATQEIPTIIQIVSVSSRKATPTSLMETFISGCSRSPNTESSPTARSTR